MCGTATATPRRGPQAPSSLAHRDVEVGGRQRRHRAQAGAPGRAPAAFVLEHRGAVEPRRPHPHPGHTHVDRQHVTGARRQPVDGGHPTGRALRGVRALDQADPLELAHGGRDRRLRQAQRRRHRRPGAGAAVGDEGEHVARAGRQGALGHRRHADTLPRSSRSPRA
nr:hypothetical protein [Angustibacter aerolatus]